MLPLLLAILLIALLLGGVGWNRYSYGALSPLAVVLLIILIAYLLGYVKL